jgi:LemA protein
LDPSGFSAALYSTNGAAYSWRNKILPRGFSASGKRLLMMIVVLVIIGVVVLAIIAMYNGLVRLRVQCDNAWSDIDVQLKRRYDLVPNLVETVKGYAGHEKGTLEAVVQARNSAMSAQGPAAKADAENMLTGALRQVFALAEAYPQLRAVESFTQLQNTLNSLEDTIQNARRYYNAVVRDLNTKIQVFPSNIIANMFNFKPREFFEVSAPAERDAPKVSFGTPAA